LTHPTLRGWSSGAAALAAASAILLAGCLEGWTSGPILANSPAVRPTQPPISPRPILAPDPQPIRMPRDDGPHERLTEWWYYTGHLGDADRRRYGFQLVIFRAERGSLPVSWAAHFAFTDESAGGFAYAQRTEIGRLPDHSPRTGAGDALGFDLLIGATDAPNESGAAGPTAWRMRRLDGIDRLDARLSPTEARASGTSEGRAISLELTSDRSPVLHDADGWIDFGPAGGSYYYSRTRLAARGSALVGGLTRPVEGSAWFDHQWGDFIAVGSGGWDWFAVNLDDGTDLTIWLVRSADGSPGLAYGTLVDTSGLVRHLPRDAFSVKVTKSWMSPRTGGTYPAGWQMAVPADDLFIELSPTVADQELDTRASTGVVYWEGSQRVRAMHRGAAIGGEAYVELTGYAR